MPIEIKEVKSKKQLTDFIYLPSIIHKGHKNWVPPIYMDDRVFFNAKKNKSFSYCDTILALAYKDGKLAGRIMGIINCRYNKIHNENDARFCFMETWEDAEVFNALISFIISWSKEKGMKNLVGPLGFSDKDPQGFLIEGLNEPIVIAANGNFEYMPRLLEKMDFEKKVDCVVYKVNIPEVIPPVYSSAFERVMNRNNVIIHEFTKRSQLKPYIRPILTLVNETFKDIYAFAPFELREMDDFANRYLLLMDPKFIKMITNKENEVIAFVIGMPDISQGIIASKGRIIPFGIFQIFRAQKRTKQLNLLLGGIKKEYRGLGLDIAMGVTMLKSAKEHGIQFIDSHLELETNLMMRAEMEFLGGTVYKRYRIYQKSLIN